MTELPEGWRVLRFGEVLTAKYGKSLDKALRVDGAPFPVVGSAGTMATTPHALITEACIVIGRKGNIGEARLFPYGCWPIDTTYFVEIPTDFTGRFLELGLEVADLQALDSSTTTPSLRREDLEGVVLSCPPLAEQDEIVRILDTQLARLDTVLAAVQAVRDKAEQFRRSLLHAAFTGQLTQPDRKAEVRNEWPAYSLGEIERRGWVKLGRGKVISKKDIEAIPGNYPIYSSAGKNGGEFGRYGDFLFDEELITWSVDGGGHLFHRPRHRFSVTNVGGWIRILDLEVFGYRYLFYALRHAHSQTIFDWSHKAHPSVIRLEYDSIPIPTLVEQAEIVRILDTQLARLDKALEVADQVERECGRLRRSLLQAAFTGELTTTWREANG